MVKNLLFLLFFNSYYFIFSQKNPSQSYNIWTESEKTYILKGLEKTKNELFDELRNLDIKYWNIVDDSTNLSVGQVVNYLILQDNRYKKEISLCFSDQSHIQSIKKTKENDQILLSKSDYSPKDNPKIYLVLSSQTVPPDKAISVFNDTRNQLCDFIISTKPKNSRQLKSTKFLFLRKAETLGIINKKYLNNLILACISQTKNQISLIKAIKRRIRQIPQRQI